MMRFDRLTARCSSPAPARATRTRPWSAVCPRGAAVAAFALLGGVVVLAHASALEAGPEDRKSEGQELERPEREAPSEEPRPRFREAVVVTAEKREQKLEEVPISIQAFGNVELRTLGATTVSDLEHAAPSLEIGGLVGTSNQYMGLRGIVDHSRNPGVDASLGFYIDGVYQGRSYLSDLPLEGVERVEILRGPQGTLFGKNTVSGAIDVVTRTPTRGAPGEVHVEYGSYVLRKATAWVGGALADKLFGSFSLAYDGSEGYYRNVTLDQRTGGHDRGGSRGKLRFLPTEKLELVLSGDWARSDNRSPIFVNRTLPPFETQQNYEARDQIDAWGGGLTAHYRLESGLVVTSLTSYRKADYSLLYDHDIVPQNIFSNVFDEDLDQFTQEVRLASPRAERHDWVSGLYYYGSRTSTTRSACFGPDFYRTRIPSLAASSQALTGCTSVPSAVDATSYAAYLHGSYRPSPRWELTGGLRFTHEGKDVDWMQVNRPADPAAAAALGAATGLPLAQAPGALFGAVNSSFSGGRAENDLSPTLGLSHFLGAETMLFGRYSRGSKSGGYNADFMLAGLDHFTYRTESVDAFEVGVKSAAARGKLTLNATAFLSKFRDYQVFQTLRSASGATTLELTNAGKVTSRGVELESIWVPVDRLQLRLNLTALDATYDRFANPDPGQPDFDGNALPFAPPWKTSLGLQYIQPLGHRGYLTFGASHSFVDDQYYDPSNREEFLIESYNLIDGRASWQPRNGRWELALWGRNLADERYHRVNDLNFFRVPRTIWGEPRTLGVSVTLFRGHGGHTSPKGP